MMSTTVRLAAVKHEFYMFLPRSHLFLAMSDEQLRDTVGPHVTVMVLQKVYTTDTDQVVMP